MTLFRTAALERADARHLGEAVRWRPRHGGWLLGILVLLLLACAWLIGQGEYRRRLPAVGYVDMVGGITRVRAGASGMVARLHVSDGQVVARGADLVTLRHPDWPGSPAAAQLEAGQVVREQLELRLQLESRLRRSERDELLTQRSGLAERLGIRRARLDVDRRNLELARAAHRRAERLFQLGHLNLELLNVAERRYLAEQGSELATREVVAELLERQGLLDVQLERLPLTSAQRVADLRAQLAQLEAEIARLQLRREQIVRAPSGGRVTAIVARPGQVLTPDSSLLSLSNAARQQVILLLADAAAAEVHVGDAVRIRFPGNAGARSALAQGVVTSLSAAALSAQELAQILPAGTDVPYAMRVARVEAPSPAGVNASHGMRILARVTTRREPLWQRLVRPLQEGWIL